MEVHFVKKCTLSWDFWGKDWFYLYIFISVIGNMRVVINCICWIFFQYGSSHCKKIKLSWDFWEGNCFFIAMKWNQFFLKISRLWYYAFLKLNLISSISTFNNFDFNLKFLTLRYHKICVKCRVHFGGERVVINTWNKRSRSDFQRLVSSRWRWRRPATNPRSRREVGSQNLRFSLRLSDNKWNNHSKSRIDNRENFKFQNSPQKVKTRHKFDIKKIKLKKFHSKVRIPVVQDLWGILKIPKLVQVYMEKKEEASYGVHDPALGRGGRAGAERPLPLVAECAASAAGSLPAGIAVRRVIQQNRVARGVRTCRAINLHDLLPWRLPRRRRVQLFGQW